ncbi:hypothetical protein [Salibacterium qingdaonense]|uniref:Uncharacterized protein n=1 Tax=Salibacterium qingdaonense TaxID=266892 RepID=A0A1I4Q0E6_9BACI|nr:hypothetical protein [Salibacterium qingdaonense]SFM33542.1 hypothetical protein SAMN04488054_1352 [Salibacterium qingdaonense]
MKRKLLIRKEVLLLGLMIIFLIVALFYMQRGPETISDSTASDNDSRSFKTEERKGNEEEKPNDSEETESEQAYKPVEPDDDTTPLKDQLERK